MSAVRPQAPSNLRPAPAELTSARVERLLSLADLLDARPARGGHEVDAPKGGRR